MPGCSRRPGTRRCRVGADRRRRDGVLAREPLRGAGARGQAVASHHGAVRSCPSAPVHESSSNVLELHAIGGTSRAAGGERPPRRDLLPAGSGPSTEGPRDPRMRGTSTDGPERCPASGNVTARALGTLVPNSARTRRGARRLGSPAARSPQAGSQVADFLQAPRVEPDHRLHRLVIAAAVDLMAGDSQSAPSTIMDPPRLAVRGCPRWTAPTVLPGSSADNRLRATRGMPEMADCRA